MAAGDVTEGYGWLSPGVTAMTAAVLHVVSLLEQINTCPESR